MASILAAPPETFTGTNGATPNTANTIVALNQGSGGSYTIQSNQGRLTTGTTQFNRTSARLVLTARADTEVLFDWVIPTVGESFPAFWMRHSTNAIDTAAGYYFTLERDQMIVGRAAAYSGTDIITKTYSGRTVGQVMRTRIAVFGNTLKARTWLASGTEDTGTWDISTSDTAVTAAGYYGFTISSASAGSKNLLVDNVNAFDSETPSQKAIAVGGTLTPGGTLMKQVPKFFTGSITPAGATLVRRIVVRIFTGSITATGAFAKRGNKLLAGAISTTGAFVKVPRKFLSGTITPAATLMRRVGKRFSGSITAAGSVLAVNAGRAFGVPGIVVMTIKKAGAVRARIRKG